MKVVRAERAWERLAEMEARGRLDRRSRWIPTAHGTD